MKGGTLQITWHGSDPVLTLDFHSLSGLLATGGADHDIKFWTLHEARDGPLPSATFHSCLSYHTAAVNVVRFSTAGDQLASGADGGEILLWKLTENSEASNMWKQAKNLRFHVKDVLDLQWSFDGALLVSGSVDNTVIIWDVAKGNPQQVLKDHMHYVQGVAWDPLGQYIASISGDRTCRIYNSKPRNSKSKSQDGHSFSCRSVLVKTELPKQEDDAAKVPLTKLNLFHDETLPSFFRRLAWSPEGSFLLVPAGIHKFPSESGLTNTAFIISRKDLSRPAVQLPGASKPVVAVRFCPVLFSCYSNMEKPSEKDSNDMEVFKLPYRLVFAVATLNSLHVYDTESPHPLVVLAGVHYAAITDIAWSHDGKFLAASSQDGFCTLVMFEPEELGSPLPSSEVPPFVAKFVLPLKDKVAGFRAQVSEAGSKVKSKGDCNGVFSVKKSNSVLGIGVEERLNGEDQAEVSKVSGEEDKILAACSKTTEDRNVLNRNLHAESCNAGHGSRSSNNTTVLERDETKGVPKKVKRITPVAISSPSEPRERPTSPFTSLATPQLCQEAKVTSEIGPEKPKRIVPVAILSAPSQEDLSAMSSGPSLQPQDEANLSLALVVEAPPTQVKCLEESGASCIEVVNGGNNDSQSCSPKNLRRITPQPIIVNPNGLQIPEASREDMKQG